MAVSSVTRPRSLIQPMLHATPTENAMAAASGETPVTSPNATPPSAACEMPAPMKAIRRRTTKKARTAHINATSTPATRARRAKS